MGIENPNLLERIRKIEERLEKIEARISRIENQLGRFPSRYTILNHLPFNKETRLLIKYKKLNKKNQTIKVNKSLPNIDLDLQVYHLIKQLSLLR